MPSAVAIITSAWTPPPTVIGFSGTVLEEESSIQLNWTVTSLPDDEFIFYRIYRRELGSTVWDTLIDINNKSTVDYADESAGQTIDYEYKITVFQSIVGDVPLESDDSEIVTAQLQADSWFIIPADLLDPIELIVTTENHTSVIQQEVFEPLASDRKRVVRGSVLGNEGQVTSVFDVSVARQSKQYFDTMNTIHGPHIFKSPFGDIWFVEFDAPSFKYQAGGHLEVTVGWVEV